MIAKFLLSIEPIRDTIEGSPRRAGFGAQVFLDAEWREKVLRPILAGVLAYTQLPEDSIDWIKVVENWSLPWPREGCRK